MRIPTVVLLFSLLGLFATGCSGPSLVGTWNVTPAEELPIPSKIKTTFVAPDSATTTVVADLSVPGMTELSLQADVVTTWKVEGEKLTTTGGQVSVKSTDGKEVPGLIADQVKSAIQDAIVNGTTGRIKWEGSDKFTLTLENGKTALFERVKE